MEEGLMPAWANVLLFAFLFGVCCPAYAIFAYSQFLKCGRKGCWRQQSNNRVDGRFVCRRHAPRPN